MFTEILRIRPQLDNSDMNNMERTLTSRFGRVAKKFSAGLKAAVVLGAGAALLEKVLNPLNETREAIDRTLNKSSDLTTSAKQFGSTPGELLRLQGLAGAKGLSPDQLDILLVKFQTAITDAIADPTKQSSVRNFTGDKDLVKGFFEFIQSVQKLNPTQQVQVQQDVFGEKQILKMSEFIQADFQELTKKLGGPSAGRIDQASAKINQIDDTIKLNAQQRMLQDFISKGNALSPSVAGAINESEKAKLARENENIKNFKAVQKAQDDIDKIQQNIQMILTQFLTQTPVIMGTLNTAVDLLRKAAEGWTMIFKLLKESSTLRGLFRLGK